MSAKVGTSELPRPYMARCAQRGDRAIVQYREELVAGCEHLRFIGSVFRDEDCARGWDDRPGNLIAWQAFPDWDSAEAWLCDDDAAGREG